MKELLKISGLEFTFSIAGPKPTRESYALTSLKMSELALSNYPTLLNARDIDNEVSFCLVKAINPSIKDSISIDFLCVDDNGSPLPIFFEHIDYNIFFKQSADDKITIHHEDSSLFSNLTEREETITSGIINFRSNVGETVFLIKKRNIILLQLTFIVYSTKLNFLHQRSTMLKEVQSIHNSLLYELLKPTKEKATSSDKKCLGIEWLTLFFQYAESLLKLVKRIENKAHNRLHTKVEIKSIAKLKGSNRNFLKQVQKHGVEGVIRTNKIWTDRKIVTNDTPENRYIKFLLYQIIVAGKKWTTYIAENKNPRDEQIIDSDYYKSLVRNIQKLERTVRNNFWVSIKLEKKLLENRGNFIFHTEFLKTEYFSRKLKKGLAYDTKGSERIYVLPMDRLYEIWTYIKIAQLIGIIKEGKVDSIRLKEKSNLFETSILTGQNSRVEIASNINIQTNRLFTQTSTPYRVPIVNQKPDIILELQNANNLILFDAKYRVSIFCKSSGKKHEEFSYKDLISKSIKDCEIIMMPKDDDINVIHRYKDAIYFNKEAKYEHVVLKGYILFPGSLTDQTLNDAKSSAEQFGVSYLPFLPGNHDEGWYSQAPFDFATISDPQSENVRAVAETLADLISSK